LHFTLQIYDFQKTAATLDDALLSRGEQSAWFTKAIEMHFVNTTKITY